MYPLYRNPHNWIVLETKTIYDFYDTPIVIVNVLIGTLHVYRSGFNGTNDMYRTPITRWITQKSYHKYLRNEDI